MSSHHIVRDEQEPALLVIDTHSAGPTTLSGLLEWSPKVLALENTLASVAQWGIKVDIAVCYQENHKGYTTLLAHQAPVALIKPQPTEQLLDCALKHLINNNFHAVTVIAPFEAGLVHALAKYHNQLDITVIGKDFRWVYLSKGIFKKWLPQDEELKVWPQDLKLISEGVDTKKEDSYVTHKDGFAKIQADAPFWLGESFIASQ